MQPYLLSPRIVISAPRGAPVTLHPLQTHALYLLFSIRDFTAHPMTGAGEALVINLLQNIRDLDQIIMAGSQFGCKSVAARYR